MRNGYLKKLEDAFQERYPHEKEYLQSVSGLLSSLEEIIEEHPEYERLNIVERLLEPERVIGFKVTWIDDDNKIRVNRGYRVQHSALIGPYKGGLRFDPGVTQSVLKFLALEQSFKNALTALPMGGGKGGSDFDPKKKSDREIMTFCQAFMRELFHHLGEDVDVPAGDIGVGQREVGYLYGYYKKLTNQVTSGMTGKDTVIGGSLVRREATGYGLVYFVEAVLKTMRNTSLKDKKVIVSGAGNVAIYAAEKVTELGGKVIAMSDSSGFIHCEEGIDLKRVKTIKKDRNERIRRYAEDDDSATYTDDAKKIWTLDADIALPCATQNELDGESVKHLVDNGVILVAEGANMPTTEEGIGLLKKHDVLFAPGKAANAGGVLVSGLEMAQNAQFSSWSFDTVDQKLRKRMEAIFEAIHKTAKDYGKEEDLQFGVNIHSFKKLAEAMMEQGVV